LGIGHRLLAFVRTRQQLHVVDDDVERGAGGVLAFAVREVLVFVRTNDQTALDEHLPALLPVLVADLASLSHATIGTKATSSLLRGLLTARRNLTTPLPDCV